MFISCIRCYIILHSKIGLSWGKQLIERGWGLRGSERLYKNYGCASEFYSAIRALVKECGKIPWQFTHLLQVEVQATDIVRLIFAE